MIRRLALILACAISAVCAVPYQELIQAEAGVRWPDRAAQIKAESGFNPKAQSYIIRNGKRVPCAQGLAQFTPTTWSTAQRLGWVAATDSPFDPLAAIRANHRYMVQIEAQFQGDWPKALGGYNAGPYNIQRAIRHADRISLHGSDAWLRALPSVTGEHAKETQGYVRNCHRYRAEILEANHGSAHQ